MMLVRFALPVFIRAGLGSGLRGLGIIRLRESGRCFLGAT